MRHWALWQTCIGPARQNAVSVCSACPLRDGTWGTGSNLAELVYGMLEVVFK